jgi:ABC-type amino acid transport substrate-binding protein
MRWSTFVLLGCLLPAGLSAEEPALRVGMDTRSPPWSFIPGQNYAKEDMAVDPAVSEAQLKKVVGIDVDVAAALAQRLKLRLQIVPLAWDGLRHALEAKRIDVIVNAFTPSQSEPGWITATEPYYTWGLLVAVRADDKRVRSFGDLAGLTVGHFRTKIVERTLRSVNPGQLKAYLVQEALFDDLKAGKLDAVIYDSPYVHWRVANDPAFRAVGEPLNKLGYHVAARAQDARLVSQLAAAVKDLIASGEAETIRRKWEERQLPSAPQGGSGTARTQMLY